ncbi:MAG: peptidylprolyl isomerase [Spirochaetaceae bacterium]|nr:peptidylprolyl isomerase [Spirochaetaceae bacterium]
MTITKNRVAGFDYTLTGADNAVLDSSEHTGPLFYLHGYENIIPGLENALEGRADGDRFTVTVPAAEAYGERNENLVLAVPLDRFPVEVREGMRFEADTSGGSRMVTVTRVSENEALVDANHPMAGLDLGFDITIRSVREALPSEMEHGHPHTEPGSGTESCGACGAGGICSAGCGHNKMEVR